MNLLGRDPNPEKRSIRRRRLQAYYEQDLKNMRRAEGVGGLINNLVVHRLQNTDHSRQR
jgi:hypothetical protein